MRKVIIAVSGRAGAGKDTFGKAVIDALNVKAVRMAFADHLKEQAKMLGWDGLEWSDYGLNRVYTDKTSQHEYDEFINRLKTLENSNLIYEIAEELDEDQTYYFEKERIYLYIESKENLE